MVKKSNRSLFVNNNKCVCCVFIYFCSIYIVVFCILCLIPVPSLKMEGEHHYGFWDEFIYRFLTLVWEYSLF